MKFRIVPASGLVEVDDKSITLDLSAFPAGIAEVRWFGQAGLRALSEGGDEHGLPMQRFTDPGPYLGYVEAARAAILARDTPTPPTLAEIKASVSAEIDAVAGMVRAQFITVTPGQEMTYLEKVTQAQALLAEEPGEIDEDDYPLMFGEVGITANNATGVAEIILQRYRAWQDIGAAIERSRLLGKKQVAEAADVEAVAAVLAGLSWPVAP